MKYLRNLVKLRDKHRLQDNTHIGGKEELDGYPLFVTWILLIDESDMGLEALDIDQDKKDYY